MAAASNAKPCGFLGNLKASSPIIAHTLYHFLNLPYLLLFIEPIVLFVSFSPNFLPTTSVVVNSTASSGHALTLSELERRQYYLVYLCFVLNFGLALPTTIFATPPLTVSVYTAYLNKDLPTIKSSFQEIPEGFTRILLTFVCHAAVFIGVVIIIFSIVAGLVGPLMVFLLEVPEPLTVFLERIMVVVLSSLLFLYHLTTIVVSYFSCKECHNKFVEALPTTTQSSLEHIL